MGERQEALCWVADPALGERAEAEIVGRLAAVSRHLAAALIRHGVISEPTARRPYRLACPQPK